LATDIAESGLLPNFKILEMKKLMLILLVIVCSFSVNLSAKCKFKKKVDVYSQAMAENCNVVLDVCTRPAVLFSKYRTSASIAMAKGSENKYFVLFYFTRTDSKKFELLKENSLDLFLSNGEKIQLFPAGVFSGNYIGLSFNFMIRCLYQVDKQQLQKLTGNNVEMVSIHYTSEKELNGSQIDQDGKFSLDYEVISKNFQASAGNLAQCILDVNF
jgi:hypothetical protein